MAKKPAARAAAPAKAHPAIAKLAAIKAASAEVERKVTPEGRAAALEALHSAVQAA